MAQLLVSDVQYAYTVLQEKDRYSLVRRGLWIVYTKTQTVEMYCAEWYWLHDLPLWLLFFAIIHFSNSSSGLQSLDSSVILLNTKRGQHVECNIILSTQILGTCAVFFSFYTCSGDLFLFRNKSFLLLVYSSTVEHTCAHTLPLLFPDFLFSLSSSHPFCKCLRVKKEASVSAGSRKDADAKLPHPHLDVVIS